MNITYDDGRQEMLRRLSPDQVAEKTRDALNAGATNIEVFPDDGRVPCPDCGNANRHARRRCKATGGMCGGSGWVHKS